MHVQWEIGEFANDCHNCGAKRNVIDEMSIHDVAVNPIGPSLLNPVNFIAQTREICGKNGRSDKNTVHTQWGNGLIENRQFSKTLSLRYSAVQASGGYSQLSLDAWRLYSTFY